FRRVLFRSHLVDMLLARQEPVGEMACQSLDAGRWLLAQGDASLEIGGGDAGLRLFRGGQCVARAHLPVQPAGDGAEGTWTIDWALEPGEGLYGLGETSDSLDRRGALLVSDVPRDRC